MHVLLIPAKYVNLAGCVKSAQTLKVVYACMYVCVFVRAYNLYCLHVLSVRLKGPIPTVHATRQKIKGNLSVKLYPKSTHKCLNQKKCSSSYLTGALTKRYRLPFGQFDCIIQRLINLSTIIFFELSEKKFQIGQKCNRNSQVCNSNKRERMGLMLS